VSHSAPDRGLLIAQIVVIWKERKTIWKSFKDEVCGATRLVSSPGDKSIPKRIAASTSTWRNDPRNRRLSRCRIRRQTGVTIVAFVVWIEIQISNDGPSEETPSQVGQWAYPTSLALLVISAAILKLKYRLASSVELEREISAFKIAAEITSSASEVGYAH
jgi:hypothetical protein